VGAWRGIGGGQGALSKAFKKTGVACIPGKQSDYSGSVRESNVVRPMSQSRNREVEMDLPETAKAVESQAPPGLPKERSVMGSLDGHGSLVLVDGNQGALTQPEWDRGSLQTQQIGELHHRKAKESRSREATVVLRRPRG